MRKALGFAGIALLGVLLIAAYYTYAPRHVPDGQPPLARIVPQNFSDLQRQFNEGSDQARILVLLSPT